MGVEDLGGHVIIWKKKFGWKGIFVKKKKDQGEVWISEIRN